MKTGLRLIIIIIFSELTSCHEVPPGKMISFGDYKLHFYDNGTGRPPVIIEPGIKCTMEVYDSLRVAMSKLTRVITYEHAGIGFSTRSPEPRSLQNYVRELRLLLQKEKIDPPYILIGHSMGGFIIRYYAHLYPDEVAGLIFIDQPPDDWFHYIRSTHTQTEVDMFDAMFVPERSTFYTGVSKEELIMYEPNTETLRGIRIPPHIPVRMLTSVQYGDLQIKLGYRPEDMKVWAEMQAQILEGVADAKQIITETGGLFLHQTEPGLVLDAVRELSEFFRNSSQ